MRNIAQPSFPERLQNCDPTICGAGGSTADVDLATRLGEPGVNHRAVSFDADAGIIAVFTHPPHRPVLVIFSILRPVGARARAPRGGRRYASKLRGRFVLYSRLRRIQLLTLTIATGRRVFAVDIARCCVPRLSTSLAVTHPIWSTAGRGRCR